MTQTTQSQISAGAVAAPDATERPGSIDSGLDRLWHFLTSMKLALVLMLAFAALTLVGTLVIQAPPGVMDDPESRAQWLAGIRPRPVLGPLADVLDRLQVFTIFTSVWIRAIGALLAASLDRLHGAADPGHVAERQRSRT